MALLSMTSVYETFKFFAECIEIKHILGDEKLRSGLSNTLILKQFSEIFSANSLRHLPTDFGPNEHSKDGLSDWISLRLAESEVFSVYEESNLAGFIFLSNPIPDDHESDHEIRHLGYILGDAFTGRGLGTKMIFGFLSSLATKNFKVRLIAGVEKDNISSIKLLEKCGFDLVVDELVNETEHDRPQFYTWSSFNK